MTTSFPAGRIVATSNCLAHMQSLGEHPTTYLDRHASGDWGELDSHDKQMNDDALASTTEQTADRILSRYSLPDGTPIYVITEHDRSQTTIMLCSDY